MELQQIYVGKTSGCQWRSENTPPAKKVFTTTGSEVLPWLNVPEFRRQLEHVGIDTTTESVSLILNDLEFGADIGTSGRARLPTLEKNSRSAFKYGDRLQEALQDLILQGAKLGPLFEEEVDLTIAKFHAMGTKVKPSGKSCGLFKTNAGVRWDPGFCVQP